jgi:hypothetical protein
MFVPRVQSPRTADGTRQLSYKERAEARRQIDRDRRIEERKRQEQERIDALHRPLEPPAPTYEQRQQARRAIEEGKREAAARAQEQAAKDAPPANPFRARAQEIQDQLGYRPDLRGRYQAMVQQADRLDAERTTAEVERQQQERIDRDPTVKTSRDYATGLSKLAPPEFQTEAAEILGIAQSGDGQLAWQKIRDLEQRIWQQQDRLAAEARQSKTVTDAQYLEHAALAIEARQRFEQADKTAKEFQESTPAK